jgi:hypothetical protein
MRSPVKAATMNSVLVVGSPALVHFRLRDGWPRGIAMRACARGARERRDLLGLVEVEDARVRLAALRREPRDVGRYPVPLGPARRVLKHRAHELAVRVDGALRDVLSIEAL